MPVVGVLVKVFFLGFNIVETTEAYTLAISIAVGFRSIIRHFGAIAIVLEYKLPEFKSCLSTRLYSCC